MRKTPPEPTGEQCQQRTKVIDTDYQVGYAHFSPQIGGYHGKAVVVFAKDNPECFDYYIWHDGEFAAPDTEPVHLHFCDIEQFLDLAKFIQETQKQISN